MLYPVKQVGAIGVNKDLSSHELPVNAFTDALNVRFLDGSARQFLGQQEAYASPSIIPYHILPVTVAGEVYWLVLGANKIYSVTGTTYTNITRQTASADVDYGALRNGWTSTVLGGVPILNNPNDTPQFWDLSGKCAALTNWPANTACAVMRAFKNTLIALDVTKPITGRFPYMVKWSNPADPGTVPTSWNQADATVEAGELNISEGYDYIIDGLALRDYFVIYKQSSVHRLDYIGGVFIYKEGKVLGTSGAMNRNCITEIDGQHFVLTTNDVVIHDGFQAQSILDQQARRTLFDAIDTTNYIYSFVFKNPYYNEIYVCYPESGQSVPNKALVWNWVTKTVTFREIPALNHASVGKVLGSSDTWATAAGTWATVTKSWSNDGSTLSPSRVLMASNSQKLYLLDETTAFDGTAISAYVERRGLSLDHPERIKLVKGIRPRISGTDGQTVLVYIGAANSPYADPTYGAAITYTIGTTVDCFGFASGRYIAVKFASGTATDWRLDSYDIDFSMRGSW